jgi:dimeric dUTPase (all-alpha-NTP-PPase superfamily)
MFSSEQFQKIFAQLNATIPEDHEKIDINEIFNAGTDSAVDFKIWMETVKMQTSFNNSVAPGWKGDKNNEKYNFWMAILDETVEVLGSKHWKWWKNNSKMDEVDWANVRVELIDLFHFILSLTIQQENEQLLLASLINLELNPKSILRSKEKDDKFFEDFWNDFLSGVQMKMLPIVAVKWVEFWYRAGGNAEDLFKEYRVKNVLNKLRQKYGYGAKNTYKKMWPDVDSDKIVEDNVVAWKLAQKIPLDENFTKEFNKTLEKYYLTFN